VFCAVNAAVQSWKGGGLLLVLVIGHSSDTLQRVLCNNHVVGNISDTLVLVATHLGSESH
jgi:hypothetical protein